MTGRIRLLHGQRLRPDKVRPQKNLEIMVCGMIPREGTMKQCPYKDKDKNVQWLAVHRSMPQERAKEGNPKMITLRGNEPPSAFG